MDFVALLWLWLMLNEGAVYVSLNAVTFMNTLLFFLFVESLVSLSALFVIFLRLCCLNALLFFFSYFSTANTKTHTHTHRK